MGEWEWYGYFGKERTEKIDVLKIIKIVLLNSLLNGCILWANWSTSISFKYNILYQVYHFIRLITLINKSSSYKTM
jgi:hypothetical protein